MSETEIQSYYERGQEVRAFRYEGEFHLPILENGEQVRAAGDGSGDVTVHYNSRNADDHFRLKPGMWIVQDPQIGLCARTDEDFRREYAPISQLVEFFGRTHPGAVAIDAD